MLNINLVVDHKTDHIPTAEQMLQWLTLTLKLSPIKMLHKDEVNIAIIDESQMTALNQTYRDKQGPTNVLSFPDEEIPGEVSESLGDIAICAKIVEREAKEQNKSIESHWAHLLIHGLLHLQGFDHIDESDAEVMEALEINIMKNLGFSNPYTV